MKISLCILFLLQLIFAESKGNVPDTVLLRENLTLFNSQLDKLTTEVLSRNRSLKVRESNIVLTDASARSASNNPPPRFDVSAMNASTASFPNPFKDQMQMDYSIEQMIMFPGKLSSMKAAELKKTEMAKYDKRSLEYDLVLKTEETFFELYLTERQLEINDASIVLLSQIVDIATKRYEVGMGTQTAVLRAQTELALTRKKVAGIRATQASMRGMLNALRDQPVESIIDKMPEITPVPFSIPFENLRSEALKNRSEIGAMQTNIEMKKKELAVASLAWYPDFMVRGTYSNVRPMAVSSSTMGSTPTKNPDTWSIMVGATIPEAPWALGSVVYKQKNTKAALESATQELQEMNNMIAAQVYTAYSNVVNLSEQVILAQTILLPKAVQASEFSLAAYTAGKEEFPMLLDTQRMLLMARDDYHMTIMQYLVALAQLKRATGTNSNALLIGGTP